MSADFLDTNVLLYLLDTGEKAGRAEALLQQGGMISVQVLNEALVNCRRKAGMAWDEVDQFLGGLRQLCPVVDLTPETHDIGRAVAQRYGYAVYDAMILAAALQNGCTQVYSEDMQHGQIIEDTLQILNPFR